MPAKSSYSIFVTLLHREVYALFLLYMYISAGTFTIFYSKRVPLFFEKSEKAVLSLSCDLPKRIFGIKCLSALREEK